VIVDVGSMLRTESGVVPGAGGSACYIRWCLPSCILQVYILRRRSQAGWLHAPPLLHAASSCSKFKRAVASCCGYALGALGLRTKGLAAGALRLPAVSSSHTVRRAAKPGLATAPAALGGLQMQGVSRSPLEAAAPPAPPRALGRAGLA